MFKFSIKASLLVYSFLYFVPETNSGSIPLDNNTVEKVEDGCFLLVVLDQDEYSSKEAIDLDITLKNTGKDIVTFAVAQPLLVLDIQVTLPNGDSAPLTLEGHRQKEAFASYRTKKIGQGEQYTYSIPALDRLFDMTLSGTYTLNVKTKVYNLQNGSKEAVQIKSKSVELTIKEDYEKGDEV